MRWDFRCKATQYFMRMNAMDYTVSSAEAFETSASNSFGYSANDNKKEEMSKLVIAHSNETAGDLAAYSTWFSIF